MIRSALMDLLSPSRRDAAVDFLTSDDITWIYPLIGLHRKSVLLLAQAVISKRHAQNTDAIKTVIRSLA
jgi:hypothetical protein